MHRRESAIGKRLMDSRTGTRSLESKVASKRKISSVMNDGISMAGSDSHAIPRKYVIEALDFMVYGSTCRVMFEMLVISGCRVCELDRMRYANLMDGTIYWRLGKNQRAMRKCKLPPQYLKEIEYYREHNRHDANLFGVDAHTFRRYFNRCVRPRLGPEWNEKIAEHAAGPKRKNFATSEGFRFQLKGLRKNYATLRFVENWTKYDDAQVGMEFTCKDLHHSSNHMTATHYIMNSQTLGLGKGSTTTPEDFLTPYIQTRIWDYLPAKTL